MSNVKNQICKVIPQLSPLRRPGKEKSSKEQSSKEQSSKEKSNKTKSSKEKATKRKNAKEQEKKGNTEKTPKKGLSQSTESNKESLSFKDLNSHFSSVQFSTKQTHRSTDPISGQIDQLTSRFDSPDRPAGNDLEEANSTHSSKHFPFHFIGVGFKSQTSRPEDDR